MLIGSIITLFIIIIYREWDIPEEENKLYFICTILLFLILLFIILYLKELGR